jgi:hypothetical protein
VRVRNAAAAVVIFASLLFCPSMFADDVDPASIIGMELKQAFDAFGAPREVFSFRGPEEWQDNVVFFYPNYTYLFWYRNRVWQVRCDGRFGGTLFGLSFGMGRKAVKEKLGRPLADQDGSLYFDIDGGKYPIRVRLVFAAESLSDVYVYRSDF